MFDPYNKSCRVQILDSCYQELTEQSGSEYVAEMDNALQFDLSSVTSAVPGPQLLARRHKTRAPVPPRIKVNE